MRLLCLFLLSVILFSACHQQKKATTAFIKDEKFQKELQEKFILTEDGGTIELPEGNFMLSKSLSIEGKKYYDKGKGVGKTILSFLGQQKAAKA